MGAAVLIAQKSPARDGERACQEELVAYLEKATEKASYSCKFSIDSVSLSREVHIEAGDRWGFLLRHLEPRQGSQPLIEGQARFHEGKFVLLLQDRLHWDYASAAAYFDGQMMVDVRAEDGSSERAVLWDGVRTTFVPELPWGLYEAGGMSTVAALRTAMGRQEVKVASVGVAEPADRIFSFPLPSNRRPGEGFDRHARITSRWSALHGGYLPVVLEECRADSRVTRRTTICAFAHASGTPMPTVFHVEVAMNGFDALPPMVVYRGRVDYTEDGPLPSQVLSLLACVPEIRTRTRTIYPRAGVDHAIKRIVAGADASAKPTAEGQVPSQVPSEGRSGVYTGAPMPAARTAVTAWPAAKEAVDAAAQGAMSRKEVTSAFCLQAALALCAQLRGTDLEFEALLKQYPEGLLAIVDAIQILERNGLRYVAAKIHRRAVLGCRDALILLESRTENVMHAVVIYRTRDMQMAWSLGGGSKSVTKSVPNDGAMDIVQVIISQADWERLR